MGTRFSSPSVNTGYLVASFLCLSPLVWCAAKKDPPVPTPLSLPPSQNWDGNDGFWSSFGLQVGTPSQSVRVLAATSGSWLSVVLAGGCAPGDPNDCGSRGYSFHFKNSSTWSDQGVYQLPLTTRNLSVRNEPIRARVGYDTITLGPQGYGTPTTLANQVILGFVVKDFYTGSLGLNRWAANLTSTKSPPRPSILQSLRDQNKIPSLSWSYTAGTFYRLPKAFGSLTLGGYDSSRFVSKNVTFQFGSDKTKDLLVGIRSIDVGGSPLLSKGIEAFIDSLVPYICLPLEVCQAFETAFGLVWNENSTLYLVSEDRHNQLIKQNPNVTFTLGPSLTGGNTVDIVMPYMSFILDIVANKTQTRYFPLRRAQDDTQYTLGRVFLQHAYIIADYERTSFSVHQALFPETSVASNLKPIYPLGFTPSKGKGGLGGGAIAGIVVGVFIVIIILCCILAMFIRRRRAQPMAAEEVAHSQSPDIGTTDIKVSEEDSNSIVHQLDTKVRDDAHGAHFGPHEMAAGQERPHVMSELPAGDQPLPELEGQSVPLSGLRTPSPDHSVLDSIVSPMSPMSVTSLASVASLMSNDVKAKVDSGKVDSG
ncbi:MAG: hypothetical protein M1816_006737 [Peltula sp. TS41687]|nr:MAG: hypothetical protein M1816_006737 [Peltula sp. TS41687]